MIKSMTGFGRCELSNEKRKITVELKSVNHRYLDVNIRMPKKLNFFESAIRTLLKEYMQRGKVDMFISYEDYSEQTLAVKYNATIAKEYLTYLQQMADEFNLENDIRVSSLSRYPEVLTMEEQSADEDELWSDLSQAIREACTQFVATRTTEGEHLKQDLVEKLHHMRDNVDKVEQRAPQIIAEYRSKLMEKDVIEAADVEAICANQINGKIFDMVDAIGRKEQKKALDLYYDLLMLKEPAMRILYLVTRHFQILMQLRDMTGKGFDNKQMAAKAGVPEFAVRKYLGQAKSFSLAQLEEIVRASVQTDENIKTGQMADQLAVELLIISTMQG